MLVQPSGVLLKTMRTRLIQAVVRHASVRTKALRALPASATKTVQVSCVNHLGIVRPTSPLDFQKKNKDIPTRLGHRNLLIIAILPLHHALQKGRVQPNPALTSVISPVANCLNTKFFVLFPLGRVASTTGAKSFSLEALLPTFVLQPSVSLVCSFPCVLLCIAPNVLGLA